MAPWGRRQGAQKTLLELGLLPDWYLRLTVRFPAHSPAPPFFAESSGWLIPFQLLELEVGKLTPKRTEWEANTALTPDACSNRVVGRTPSDAHPGSVRDLSGTFL